MNRLRSSFLALGLLLAVSAAQAQEPNVKANIPFDFVVGNETLPAGEYLVTSEGSSNQVILIRASEGKAVALALGFHCSSGKPSETTKLVFHTLAGRYFLSQIWTQGYDQGRQLPRSKTETQLAKNNNPNGEFVLAANVSH
jgi:hypothetical protein